MSLRTVNQSTLKEPTYELGCSGPHGPCIHDLAGMITDRTTPELLQI